MFEQGSDVLVGQVGDAGQVLDAGCGQQFSGGVTVDQLDNPAVSDNAKSQPVTMGRLHSKGKGKHPNSSAHC